MKAFEINTTAWEEENVYAYQNNNKLISI